MKKLVVSLMVLLIFFIAISIKCQVWASDEYTIATLEELYNFAEEVNNGNSFKDKKVCLLSDINLEGNEDNQWIPIGILSNCAFEGTFEGNGHVISGMYINNTQYRNVGFFGYNKGTIQNVALSDSYINIKDSNFSVNIGNIAGYNEGTIQYSYNDSNIDTEINYRHAYTYIGGIARCGFGENSILL